MELWTFLLKESPQKTVLIVLMAMTAGLTGGLFAPAVLNVAEKVSTRQPAGASAWILLGLAGLFILSKRLSQLQAAAVTEQALERLFNRVADTLRRAELAQFEKLNRADIYLSLTNAQTITNAAAKSIDVLQHVIVIGACWGYLFHLSAQAGVVFLSALLLVVLIIEVFQAFMQPLAREEADAETGLFTAMEHLLVGFKELKLNRRKQDDLFVNHLTPLVTRTRTIRVKLLFYYSEYTLFITGCLYLVMGIMIFFLALMYPVGVILKFLTITLYISTPAFIIYDALPYIASGQAALHRLLDVAGQLPAAAASETDLYQPTRETVRDFRELALEDVTFTYPAEHDAPGFSIGPLNLRLQQGDLVFLSGGNGSGKSTLVKVLTGLYHPAAGILKINGKPVNMANHRYLFAAIFPEAHVFDRLYGISPVDPPRVQHLAAQMELSGKTQLVDDRFSPLTLSTGQQKRLALIVALLEDKPVYVFDEWAADQDPHFRRYFYEELLPALKAQGKTIIAVTHDDAYFHRADRLIRMEYGKILEELKR